MLIWSEDTAGNAGSSTGWTDASAEEKFPKRQRNFGPHEDDTLDLAKLDAAGLLIEIDRGIAEPDAKVLPSLDDNNTDVTESANPYLQLKFSESAENTAALTFEAVTASAAGGDTPVVTAIGMPSRRPSRA